MAALSAVSLIWLEVLGPGCGGAGTPQQCETACGNYLGLGCASSCDCSLCSTAADACSGEALGCAGAVTTCGDLSACLSSSAGCDTLIATLCP
jgi:hypothetical protein